MSMGDELYIEKGTVFLDGDGKRVVSGARRNVDDLFEMNYSIGKVAYNLQINVGKNRMQENFGKLYKAAQDVSKKYGAEAKESKDQVGFIKMMRMAQFIGMSKDHFSLLGTLDDSDPIYEGNRELNNKNDLIRDIIKEVYPLQK